MFALSSRDPIFLGKNIKEAKRKTLIHAIAYANFLGLNPIKTQVHQLQEKNVN
jgi:hypothetical protein